MPSLPDEREEREQRIGETESMLRFIEGAMKDGECDPGDMRWLIRALRSSEAALSEARKAERERFEACGYDIATIEQACEGLDEMSGQCRASAAQMAFHKIEANRAMEANAELFRDAMRYRAVRRGLIDDKWDDVPRWIEVHAPNDADGERTKYVTSDGFDAAVDEIVLMERATRELADE